MRLHLLNCVSLFDLHVEHVLDQILAILGQPERNSIEAIQNAIPVVGEQWI